MAQTVTPPRDLEVEVDAISPEAIPPIPLPMAKPGVNQDRRKRKLTATASLHGPGRMRYRKTSQDHARGP